MNLKDYIASIPDYPEKGIIFRDKSPLRPMVKLIVKRQNKLLIMPKRNELIW